MKNVARFIADQCLNVQPGEDVLIVCDYPHIEMAQAFGESLSCPLVCVPSAGYNGEEPPPQVSHIFTGYDAILALTTFSMGPTDARKKACEKGVRFVSMAGITRESLQTIVDTDYQLLEERGLYFKEILERAECVTVESGGLRLEMSVKGRHPMPLTGRYTEKGAFGTLPEGEVLISPVEESVEGSFAVDIGMVGLGFLKDPIIFHVHKGQVISSEGETEALERLLNAHQGSRQIAECAVGTNPAAKLNTIFEAKKMEGTCHISLGDNHTIGGRHRAGIHMDGVISQPTVTIDKTVVVDHGALVI
jgi:leucyl aminopeptidase (aminopeptidase T)